MTKENETKDLTKTEMLPDTLRDIFDLKANMVGVIPRLPQIGIVHRAELFQWPDETTVPKFEGIIIDTNRINAWWEIPYGQSGGGTPPDCFSMDGIESDQNGNNVQAELCRDCEKNKFGSDEKDDGSPGRGKACKNMKRVHVLIMGEMLPHRMTLPPSSLKVIDDYISRLTSKGLPYQLTYTTFKLVKAQNKDGVAYSEIKLERGELITDEKQARNLAKLLREFQPVMRGQEIVAEEYKAEEV